MRWPKEIIPRLILPVTKWNPKASGGDSFVYIDISSVDSHQKKIASAKIIPCLSAPSRARQLVKGGDVLVSTVRPNLNCVASVDNSLDGSTASTGFCVLRCDKTRLEPKYLFHWVQTESFISDMVAKATGASYPAVSDAIIHDSEIPLPPLEEQRRIAAILDKCYQLRKANEDHRHTLNYLRLAYFRSLFGDLSKVSKKWPQQAISSCAACIQAGPFGSLLHQSDYVRGGVPITNPKHISNGMVIPGENETIDHAKAEGLLSYRLQEGDVLLARRGEMGRCAAITDKEAGYLCGTGSMHIRPSREALEPSYLAALLSTKRMKIAL